MSHTESIIGMIALVLVAVAVVEIVVKVESWWKSKRVVDRCSR